MITLELRQVDRNPNEVQKDGVLCEVEYSASGSCKIKLESKEVLERIWGDVEFGYGEEDEEKEEEEEEEEVKLTNYSISAKINGDYGRQIVLFAPSVIIASAQYNPCSV